MNDETPPPELLEAMFQTNVGEGPPYTHTHTPSPHEDTPRQMIGCGVLMVCIAASILLIALAVTVVQR